MCRLNICLKLDSLSHTHAICCVVRNYHPPPHRQTHNRRCVAVSVLNHSCNILCISRGTVTFSSPQLSTLLPRARTTLLCPFPEYEGTSASLGIFKQRTAFHSKNASGINRWGPCNKLPWKGGFIV